MKIIIINKKSILLSNFWAKSVTKNASMLLGSHLYVPPETQLMTTIPFQRQIGVYCIRTDQKAVFSMPLDTAIARRDLEGTPTGATTGNQPWQPTPRLGIVTPSHYVLLPHMHSPMWRIDACRSWDVEIARRGHGRCPEQGPEDAGLATRMRHSAAASSGRPGMSSATGSADTPTTFGFFLFFIWKRGGRIREVCVA